MSTTVKRVFLVVVIVALCVAAFAVIVSCSSEAGQEKDYSLTEEEQALVEQSATDGTALYSVGDAVDVEGTITSISSNSFTIEASTGFAYKCFPASDGVLDYLTVGYVIEVSGDVLSTSVASVNLENVTFQDYGHAPE